MSQTAAASRRGDGLSRRLLQGTGVLWFLVAAIGQAAFIYFIVAFYATRTLRGDFAAWNDKPLIDGHIEGDSVGNTAFVVHVLLAAIVTLCGLLQLIPQIRARWPLVHRWSGRTFLTLSFVSALTGIWLTLVRGTQISTVSTVAILIDAILILIFATLAWRFALARRFDIHKRWAMRTFMVVSGVWFLRVGLMGWAMLTQGAGMSENLSGPADSVLVFACYLAPLAILELYWAAQRATSPVAHIAAALLMIIATLYTGVGVTGAILMMWAPYF